MSAVVPPPAPDFPHKLKLFLKRGAIYADAAELYAPSSQPAAFIDSPELAKTRFDTLSVKEAVKRDTAPIPHPDNRENYARGNDLRYWLSGYTLFRNVSELAAAAGVSGGRYYDFGGSSGRLFRHFGFQSNAWEVWSSDFKPSSVEWNMLHFPTRFRVFLNSAYASLPLPDGYFDLVTAMSVFTHINESETGWLLELRRLIRVGGVLCATIHDGQTWKDPPPDLRDYIQKFRPDIAPLPELPSDRLVIEFRQDDPYNCQVFHSHGWIHRQWGRFFEVCEIRPKAEGSQAIVILRRTS